MTSGCNLGRVLYLACLIACFVHASTTVYGNSYTFPGRLQPSSLPLALTGRSKTFAMHMRGGGCFGELKSGGCAFHDKAEIGV